MAKAKKIVENKVEEKLVVEQPIKKRELDKDTLVTIMNNTTGGLIYVNNRTQQEWRMEGYGVTDQMPLSELIAMKASQPKFIFDAWLLILDDDVVEHLGLVEFYKNVLKPNELDGFYKLEEHKIKEFLEKAPSNIKSFIVRMTKEKVAKKELNDLFVIKLIEDILKVEILE